MTGSAMRQKRNGYVRSATCTLETHVGWDHFCFWTSAYGRASSECQDLYPLTDTRCLLTESIPLLYGRHISNKWLNEIHTIAGRVLSISCTAVGCSTSSLNVARRARLVTRPRASGHVSLTVHPSRKIRPQAQHLIGEQKTITVVV